MKERLVICRKASSNNTLLSDQIYSAEGAIVHAQEEAKRGNRRKELQPLCGNIVYF
jgi:hypothetical protein